MKKVYFFFLFLVLASTNVIANTELKEKNIFKGCNSEINENFLVNYDKLKIKKIDIETNNYRNWTVNGIKIITSNSRYIDDIYKKRFKAKVTVYFEDGSECFYSGRIRHSGDQKDHISLHDNYILQSIDVHLDNGNIRGITKFKLLRPNTRGVLEDVIIQTQLLRNFDYLAPRSLKVNAKINKAESVMLFQEKASKELLEFNNRREGPILESDEKYFWKSLKNIPDNQLSNWSAGVVPLLNKSAKYMLAKLTNANLIVKNEIYKEISYDSLSKLNLIYLYYANRFQDGNINNYNYSEYDLDNTLLGLFDKKNIEKLNIYNLLLQSTNSYHGLASNNRKFYWNSFDSYFEPINYDANPNIDADLSLGNFRLPVSKDFLKSFDLLEKKIEEINIKNFKRDLESSGIIISDSKIENKLFKIKKNLNLLKDNYKNYANKEDIIYNQFKPIENISEVFYQNIKDVEPNIYVIKHDVTDNDLIRCSLSTNNCDKVNFSNNNIADLLEGDFNLEGSSYQYLGKKFELSNIGFSDEYKKLNFKNTNIFIEKNVRVLLNEDTNTIEIFQESPGARIYFKGGELKDLKIIFNGFNVIENGNLSLKTFPKNYPINDKTLTGCLSFVDLKVSKLSVEAINSSCEDTINFINVDGHISEISINNSFSDALDVDFSRLKIDKINIEYALNDCVDFSAGSYELGKLNLKNCGDKALSVGEKSFIKLNEIIVKNANIGIASKDSSIVKANKAYLDNLETCVAAYKKKQEFLGALIKVKKKKCTNFYKIADIDIFSKIYEGDKILKNFTFGDRYDLSELKLQQVNGKPVIKNFHKDYKAFNNDNSVNVVVEIPAGMSEKWEVSKSATGALNREFYMGKPRSINYKPYPVNYGIIPNTVLPLRVGGDGDPLDALVLGPSLTQGDVVKVKILGVIRMKDFGENDDKIVAVPLNDSFSKYENLLHFKNENPKILEEITNWFENYKGKNVVTFEKLGTVSEAQKLINYTNREYKKSGLRPRS